MRMDSLCRKSLELPPGFPLHLREVFVQNRQVRFDLTVKTLHRLTITRISSDLSRSEDISFNLHNLFS